MPTWLLDQLPLQIPGQRTTLLSGAIIRLEGDGNYSLLYSTQMPRPLLLTKTLKYFEDRLPGFIRISKACLVNPAFVTETRHSNTRTLELMVQDGTCLTVPYRRITATLDQLAAYRRARED